MNILVSKQNLQIRIDGTTKVTIHINFPCKIFQSKPLLHLSFLLLLFFLILVFHNLCSGNCYNCYQINGVTYWLD